MIMKRMLLALVLLGASLGVPTVAAAQDSAPVQGKVPKRISVDHATLDRSLDKLSKNGLFRVRLASSADPIPLNQIHSWSITLTDPAGKPIPGAVIQVDGGMPEHGHGLPTAPRVEAGTAPGEYVIRGLEFSMTGWWELRMAISANGQADTATFNVVL